MGSLYVTIIIIVLLVSITLLATDSFAVISKEDILSVDHEPDKRTRVRTHEPTYAFEFQAYNICNEKYGQCFDIWGEGTYNFGQLAAHGNYVKYVKDTTFVMERSWWRDTDFIDASEIHVNFKAETGVAGAGLASFIIIEVLEGEASDMGAICVYGNLFDKQDPSDEADADCIDSAYVKIEPTG
ncbi:MAG: hypothetical protein ACE5KA_05040 [Nitrososphaerales archaeon]